MPVFRCRIPLSVVLVCLAPATALPNPPTVEDDQDTACLAVDPLLIALGAEVWTLLAQEDNPVWPGWNAANTPLLFYRPGVQDVLINHPSPPDGFRPFEGVPDFLDFAVEPWDLDVRSGETLIALDGQNTSRSIGGVQTLVVADTGVQWPHPARVPAEGRGRRRGRTRGSGTLPGVRRLRTAGQ